MNHQLLAGKEELSSSPARRDTNYQGAARKQEQGSGDADGDALGHVPGNLGRRLELLTRKKKKNKLNFQWENELGEP